MALKKPIPKEAMKLPEEQFGTHLDTSKPSYLGIILGVLIIILMCILAGLYMWGESLKKNEKPQVGAESTRPTAEQNNEPESTNAEADVETLKTLSPSNELDAIEADLGSTQIPEVEPKLTTIDSSIQSEVQ